MATPDVLIGNRYRLVRELGAGGMSVVWEAHDERLDRRVAVKQLRLEPGLSEQESRTVSERAMREARINARLQHPHAVAILDVVEHEGRPCLVMELVSARTLADAQRESASHTLEPAQVAPVGSQVASALAAAHALGIVHRDIKPSNILIGADGRARISDFGISRATGDSTFTMTGMISGTPAYLAPEVALGNEATAASDVFSLGATLHAALEGSPPFGTDRNAIALLHRVAEGTVPTPRRAGDLAPLLSRMLARDPNARPGMAEVATVLTGLSSADSDSLSVGGLDVVTVAIPPPTGARPAIDVGPTLGVGGAAADLTSTTPPRTPTALPAIGSPAATPTDFQSTPAPPAAAGPPIPPHRSRRLGLITAAVAVVVLVAAVAIVSLLWRGTVPPDPNPNASAVPSASEQQTEDPAGKEGEGQQTQDTDSGGAKATNKPTESSAGEEPTQSSETTETAAPTGASEPAETQPGEGNSDGNNTNGNGNGNSEGNNGNSGGNNGNSDGNNGNG